MAQEQDRRVVHPPFSQTSTLSLTTNLLMYNALLHTFAGVGCRRRSWFSSPKHSTGRSAE